VLEGPPRAAGVLRGLLLGLYGFVGFFFVLAALLERAGITPAFHHSQISSPVVSHTPFFFRM
jgi:hypothetical protein